LGREDNAHPRADTKSHIDRSTHGAVKRRPTWLVTPQKRHVLQEPHDMQAARSTARWARVGRTHLFAEGARGNTNAGGSTMMALHDGMHVPRGSGGSVKLGRKIG
jgi:hypothetical protein